MELFRVPDSQFSGGWEEDNNMTLLKASVIIVDEKPLPVSSTQETCSRCKQSLCHLKSDVTHWAPVHVPAPPMGW